MKQIAATQTGGDVPHSSRNQLAANYSVSLRTVDEWMARGWIPFLRVGKLIRFSLPEVDAALRERFEVKAKPPVSK